MRITGLLLSAVFISGLTAAEHKAEPAGAPPAELDAAIVAQLDKAGSKVLREDGSVFCEIWFRSSELPAGATPEESATFSVKHGALLGAIRFPAKGEDRRGQSIQPGVYTLRYSVFPINGDHQGVAPQRDFAIMTPAADDKDPNATPTFDALMVMSRKASGTPHPAVLSIWKQEPGDFKPGLSQMGEHDWVLQGKVGDQPVAVIVIGRAEG
jgi:hypothetical protein